MLSPNGSCFLAVPNNENKRILHPGKVQESSATKAIILFDEELALDGVGEVTLFADWRGKFHQQGAKLVGVKTPGSKPIIEFLRQGEAVNCESRGCYRVSVASQEIPLTVAKQPNCTVTDISPEGISVITPQPLQVGTSVDVNLTLEGVYAQGSMRVQTEKKLPSGKLRYGLFAAEKKSQLRKSLESLASLMQRRQLRMLARAA